jgi:hypothetical protein
VIGEANTIESGSGSLAVGNANNITGEAQQCIALGNVNTLTGGAGNISAGMNNTITGANQCLAFGNYIQIIDEAQSCFALGSGSANIIDGGTGNISSGSNTITSGLQCLALGYSNTVTGSQTFALGSGNSVSGNQTVGIGNSITLIGNQSFALGNSSSVAGTCAVAIGSGIALTGLGGGLAVGNGLIDNGNDFATLSNSGGVFYNSGSPLPGSLQIEEYTLGTQSTGTAAQVLTATVTSGATPATVASLPISTAVMFDVKLIASNITTPTSVVAWSYSNGVLYRGATGNVVMIAPTLDITQKSTGTYNAPVIAADTVNQGFAISWAAPAAGWRIGAWLKLIKVSHS